MVIKLVEPPKEEAKPPRGKGRGSRGKYNVKSRMLGQDGERERVQEGSSKPPKNRSTSG